MQIMYEINPIIVYRDDDSDSYNTEFDHYKECDEAGNR